VIPLLRESEDLIFLWAFRSEDTGEGRREWTRTLFEIRKLPEVRR
jgi:hypothetical protein